MNKTAFKEALEEYSNQYDSAEENERCETCAYSCYTKNEETKKRMECRRHAPTIIHGGGVGWSNQKFPFVGEEAWCGEWLKDRG